MAESEQDFPREERLRKSKDFKQVFRTGTSTSGRCFLVYCAENNLNRNRLGIIVKKEIASAVGRNRIKRLCREVYRRNKNKIEDGFDIVISARRGAKDTDYNQVKEELLKLIPATIDECNY